MDRFEESRATTARLKKAAEALTAESRAARAEALATRLASRPESHFARLAGEGIGRPPITALARQDGSVDGDRTWLCRAGFEEGLVFRRDPLSTTLSLSRSCARLLDVRLLDVGRPNVPIAGGCYAMKARSETPFLMTVTEDGDTHHVRLIGEIDIAVSGCVKERLIEIAGSTVDVDISELTFLDASGISALVTARRQVIEGGNGFRIRGARGIVRRVFELTDLGDVLDDQ